MILRIDFISHSGDEPEIIASFFWSDTAGLRCTNPDLLQELKERGIVIPPGDRRVFPSDGRAFFDALEYRQSSYMEVTAARAVTGG